MFDLTCGDTCSLSEAERERAPSLDEIQVCSRPASTTRTLSPGGTTQEEAQPSNYKHLQRSRPFPELGTQIQRELGPPVAWGTAHLPSGRRRRSGWNAPAQRIFQVTLPSLLPCPSLPPQYAAGLGQSPWSVLPPLPPIAPPATRPGRHGQAAQPHTGRSATLAPYPNQSPGRRIWGAVLGTRGTAV